MPPAPLLGYKNSAIEHNKAHAGIACIGLTTLLLDTLDHLSRSFGCYC
jgi:hypothetical protein